MGYFPNGSSGTMYEEKYCDKCKHGAGEFAANGCAVWLAHALHNYDECNNKNSILHLLIPIGDDGFCGKCEMFIQATAEDKTRPLFKEP